MGNDTHTHSLSLYMYIYIHLCTYLYMNKTKHEDVKGQSKFHGKGMKVELVDRNQTRRENNEHVLQPLDVRAGHVADRPV